MNVGDERDARLAIDELLLRAGWDISDTQRVRTEVPVVLETGGIDSGRADYVLYGDQRQPLAVIEAKRNGIHPYAAKQQALPYAQALGAPFVFLTNGDMIYFWDYQQDDARLVGSFYSQRDLERIIALRTMRQPLSSIEIPSHYLRHGQAREVRPYQREAMRALDHAFELGKRRFLLELPTGTGKTDLIALYLRRLLQGSWAERILFLVDREQLAKQALTAIQDLLPEYSSYWLRAGGERQEAQITVALLQTMTSQATSYSSGHFDVVVMDESHRSIYGAWQNALTWFDAIHIGLTATPANYIERNTFGFYECPPGSPDFSYSLAEALDNGFLVPYRFAEGITQLIDEGTNVDEDRYDPVAFELTWTNEASNRLMMAEFDRVAWDSYRDLAPGQSTGPGKAIVFAITKHHASRLAQYLNELHPELKGKYAEVITSDVSDPDGVIRRFKRDTYPMVAVSVGMLDTGFDCPEVLHVVLCRRVLSPILYQQIRGRGTRTAPHIGKRAFVIYDFFGNRQHFNDVGANHLDSSRGDGARTRGNTSRGLERELEELGLNDEWLQAVSYVEVGLEGERIDRREYVSAWENTIRRSAEKDSLIGKVRDGIGLSPDEEDRLTSKLNTPRHYFNEENLRRAYRRPSGDLVDFVRAALGTVSFKSREEQFDELFRSWLSTQQLTPEQAEYLTLLKNRGVVQGRLDMQDLFSPPLSVLGAASKGVELFGESGLRNVVTDLDAEVLTRAPEEAG